MLKTLYKYELKKVFCAKLNMIAVTGAVIMLVLLAVSSISEARPVSRYAAGELAGRAIDAQLIDEMRPALWNENGTTAVRITADYEKYVPVVDIMDVMMRAEGNDLDLTRVQGSELYDLREKKLNQQKEKQGLTETEKEFWRGQEAQVQKPFVYRYHRGPANLLRSFQILGFFIMLLSAVGLSGVYAKETADDMNQLLLCSRYGKKEIYMIKFAAGLTWILTTAVTLFLSILIPFAGAFGMEGMGEMLQLVNPLSMLPYSIGHMMIVYMGIYLLAAVFFAAVTMLLSVITQNSLAVTCGLMGYLLIDLFVEFPDRFRVLQKIWMLRPNAILKNGGFSYYRLIHIFRGLLLNYQAAPILYALIIIGALFIGRWKYRRLQVGK